MTRLLGGGLDGTAPSRDALILLVVFRRELPLDCVDDVLLAEDYKPLIQLLEVRPSARPG